MAESQESQDSGAQVSEAQIAVHWREEEYYPPPPTFVAQANAADPAIFERFAEDKFPDCFKEYADLLTWDEPWHTTLDTSNPPFWKWFVGGKLNASLQLRRPARRGEPGQDRDHLRAGAGVRRATSSITYRGAVSPGERVRGAAARLAGPEGRRPGDAAHADGARAAGHDAGLRPARRHSLAGVRRVQRQRLRGPDRRLRQPGPDHHGRLLPRRPADRPQGEGRRGASRQPARRARRSTRCWSGSATPASTPRRPRWSRAATSSSTSCSASYRGQRVEPVSMPAEAPLFLMYTSGTTGQPEGLPAQHRRLPGLRDRDVEVLPGHPPRRRVLVHGRHRLDHRPFLHRLRAAGARHHDGDLRGRAQLSRRRAALADRRAARREHLPHLADRDPDAAQGRPGRAEEVQLPLQAHDHGGRADRARGLALVLHRGRQGRGGHRRHLVADRERRLPVQHAAGAAADEARQLRARRARHLPGDLRRGRQRGPGGQRQGRQHLHPQPVAGHLPDHLGPAGAVRRHLLRASTTRTRTARTGATGRTSPATARCRPPTATSGSSAGSTT